MVFVGVGCKMHGGVCVCDGGKWVAGPGGGNEGCSGWGLVRSGLLLDHPFGFLCGLLLGCRYLSMKCLLQHLSM